MNKSLEAYTTNNKKYVASDCSLGKTVYFAI